MTASLAAPTARLRSRATPIAGMVVALAGCYWAYRHIRHVMLFAHGLAPGFGLVFTAAFALLAWTTVLGYLERPHTTTATQQGDLDRLRVTVSVPAYNEDPAALAACVRSLTSQTRPPQRVHVVDDGSTTSYGDLPAVLVGEATTAGVELVWGRQDNAGKRAAQVAAFTADPDADVYVTVDSDSLLEPAALDELLKPFADPRVGSVAGVVTALNVRRGLLTRMTDLWFVVGQLVDRSSLSSVGAVLVNCGPLAAYRATVIRPALPAYTKETFLGRRVEFSDDSMLTLFALAAGYRAVQQPTAFAFTLMPQQVGHHLRQYLRWMRGATIRSFWRFRYLPLSSYAFWAHLAGWVQMATGTVVILILLIGGLALDPLVVPWLLLIPIFVGYAQALRYLQVARSDVPLAHQVTTVALSPLATAWSYTVLRVVRWYGMATCWRTGVWGTRSDGVEVTLDEVLTTQPTPATTPATAAVEVPPAARGAVLTVVPPLPTTAGARDADEDLVEPRDTATPTPPAPAAAPRRPTPTTAGRKPGRGRRAPATTPPAPAGLNALLNGTAYTDPGEE